MKQRYGDEAVIRDGLFTVALIIQGAVRQRQVRRANDDCPDLLDTADHVRYLASCFVTRLLQ